MKKIKKIELYKEGIDFARLQGVDPVTFAHELDLLNIELLELSGMKCPKCGDELDIDESGVYCPECGWTLS